MSERQAHWLRRNAAERTPRRVVTIDCEARRNISLVGERHDFRCAVAAFDTLDANAKPTGETKWLHADSAAMLWWFVADFTNTAQRTVLFAHNLSYDIRISSALEYLPQLGYECKQIALTSASSWARFSCRGKSLLLCDSLSFVPASLEKIAGALRREKPPLPNEDDDEAVWLERCRADVEVTREAMLRVLRYIKQEHLGDFRQTGAAQASAAFRHRFLPPKSLLVHDDDEALAAERRAAWSGRAEVWTHGAVQSPVYEFDYENAYANIGFSNDLPVRLIGSHSGIPWQRMGKVMEHYAVVADCVVDTECPCVPCDYDGRVLWPVGRFRTSLWDCEINLARREGATVEVERYWFYKRAPLLRAWAKWILGELSKPTRSIDPIARMMLKDWSRSLIGRFALRYSELEKIADVPKVDCVLRGVWDADENIEREYLHIGKQIFERMRQKESPNSTPFVTSWIMAKARVQLWEAMQHAGKENVYYCDTDGVLVNREAKDTLRDDITKGALPGLRLKSSWQGGVFRSPRNVDVGDQRRVVGAPLRAERLTPGVYRGEVWESLSGALRHTRANQVFLHNRHFTISETDRRRQHLAGGRTAPYIVTLEGERNIAVGA